MKYLSSFLVLFLISGVEGFDLVIDDIPDVSIQSLLNSEWKQQ